MKNPKPIPEIILCIQALRNIIERARDNDISLYNETIEEWSELEKCIKDVENA